MIGEFKIKTLIAMIISSLFVVLHVMIVNYDSTSGREFERYSSILKKLQYENAQLTQKVASASSIMTIGQKAKMLGFNSQKSLVSFFGPQPLAAADIGLQ